MLRNPLIGAALVCCAAIAEAKPPDDKNHTLIFAGGAHGDRTSPTLAQLKDRLARLDAATSVLVFTGNYSDAELPAPDSPGRAKVEGDLRAHVDATFDFVARGGRVFYLPGHQDFAGAGSESVRQMRTYLNRAYAKARPDGADEKEPIDVMPNAGCGDTALIDVDDHTSVLLVDSQWWTQDWLADPLANAGCELKTREHFVLRVHDEMLDHRITRLIVASHHPLKSYGPYGGSFPPSAHLTPFPVAGTAAVIARQSGLVEQHQNHPMVRSYVEAVFNEAQRNGAFVFVSGHEQSLQWVEVAPQTQLIAGTTGRTAEPVVAAEPGDFAAAAPGWVEIALPADGTARADFITDPAAAPAFTHALPDLASAGPAPKGPPPPMPKGPVMARYSKHDVWQFGAVMKLMAGSYYADAFQLELPYDVLDLEKEGLTPIQIGGGFQTNGLHLRDRNGHEWALRATTKESRRLLPYPYNQISAATRLLDHGMTASHPEAALAAAKLAQTIGVLAPEPKLWFLPDQEALGPYRGFIQDELVLVERRAKEPKNGTALPESIAGPKSAYGETKFRSTPDFIEKRLDKPQKHKLDQVAWLRARLLDMFLGDWDRHLGQWRFAGIPQADGSRTYLPIARDRDQAFGNYDAAGLWLAKITSPERRTLRAFSADFGSIGWLTYSGRDLDPLFLNALTHAQWVAEAERIKAALTDQAIDDAFETWHPDAYALNGAFIADALKTRRDHLLEAAEAFYALAAARPDLPASRGDDVFDLWFQPGGAVRVTVRGKKDTAPWFDRTYQPDETKELRMYALEGDDWLYVHGRPHGSMLIRWVGGEGQDVVAAAVPGAEPLDASAIRLYDAPEGARIDASVEVTDERSHIAHRNQYTPNENHLPSHGMFIPGFIVNPDDGLFVGGKFTWQQQGWKVAPYAALHDVSAYFATATLGAGIDYRGVFPESVALLDQQLDVGLRTPQYTRNFFGLTNVYMPDEGGPDYYRVRQAKYEARYGLSKTLRERTRLGLQLTGAAIVTEATPGRFVSESPDVTPDTLGPRYFLGARFFAETNTFDSLGLPKRGVGLHVSAESRYDVGTGSHLSTNYKLAGALAVPFDRGRRFVLITRAAVEGIVGQHAFYFAPTLGGEGQLRAYRREQFAGDLTVSHSSELRIDVWRIESVMPGTVGVTLSVDHGRVFGEGIASNDYHVSFGGGVWWAVLDVFGVSFAYHRSIEGAQRFSLMVGPLFTSPGF